MAKKRKRLERIPTRSYGPILMVFYGLMTGVAAAVTIVAAVFTVVRFRVAMSVTDPVVGEQLAEVIARFLLLTLVGAVGLVVMALLLRIQLSRSREEADIVFAQDSVWIPANGLKRNGRHIAYSDVHEVETYSRDRNVRVHFKDGRLAFNRDFFLGRMGDFVTELRRRAGLSDDDR